MQGAIISVVSLGAAVGPLLAGSMLLVIFKPRSPVYMAWSLFVSRMSVVMC